MLPTQLLSGPSSFVLRNSGHIQSLANPPGNTQAHDSTGGEPASGFYVRDLRPA